MGCDIHMQAEIKKDGKWKPAGKVFKNPEYKENPKYSWEEDEFTSEPYDGRNYRLFGVLANVRNGYGFAGVDTGDAIPPISEPRGLPHNLSDEIKQRDDEEFALGDHSKSYLTLRELLDYPWDREIVVRGCVNAAQYRAFKRSGKPPESWSGAKMGPNIVSLDMQEYDDLGDSRDPDIEYSIKIEWRAKLSDYTEEFVTKTIPKLEKLGKPEEVRIVFGFDS